MLKPQGRKNTRGTQQVMPPDLLVPFVQSPYEHLIIQADQPSSWPHRQPPQWRKTILCVNPNEAIFTAFHM